MIVIQILLKYLTTNCSLLIWLLNKSWHYHYRGLSTGSAAHLHMKQLEYLENVQKTFFKTKYNFSREIFQSEHDNNTGKIARKLTLASKEKSCFL